MKYRALKILFVTFIVTMVLSVAAVAQSYPTKTIRIIVSHPAGGSPDILARLVASRLSQRVGQPVIIENRAGANGSLAAEAVSRMEPDGYSLLLAGSSIIVTNPFLYPKVSGAILTGLTPLTNLAGLDFILAGRSTLEAKTFSATVAAIKANPGKFTMATTNIGSFQYLGVAMLKQQGMLDFITVPHSGGATAATAVAGSHADLVLDAAVILRPLADSDRLNILATTGATRDPSMPHVPTIAESGFPGYQVRAWIGMMAPAGTPPPVLTFLHSNISASMKEADVQEQIKKMGMSAIANTPADFTNDLVEERARWKRVIDTLGLKLD